MTHLQALRALLCEESQQASVPQPQPAQFLSWVSCSPVSLLHIVTTTAKNLSAVIPKEPVISFGERNTGPGVRRIQLWGRGIVCLALWACLTELLLAANK